MKSVKIVLSMAESVKHFVNIVSKYPYDIDLRSGRFLIDAKSQIGRASCRERVFRAV